MQGDIFENVSDFREVNMVNNSSVPKKLGFFTGIFVVICIIAAFFSFSLEDISHLNLQKQTSLGENSVNSLNAGNTFASKKRVLFRKDKDILDLGKASSNQENDLVTTQAEKEESNKNTNTNTIRNEEEILTKQNNNDMQSTKLAERVILKFYENYGLNFQESLKNFLK